MERFYPIGTPGRPWGEEETRQWFAAQRIRRSYHDEVLVALDGLADPTYEIINPTYEIINYGALSIDAARYPLQAVRLAGTSSDNPWILITGGVHGYETSGVQGALRFLTDHAAAYLDRANLVVAPCVSPWGYETINRWNPEAIDPNRSFSPDSPAEECRALLGLVAGLDAEVLVHLDLHETTDSDESEFRPALAARDGRSHEPGLIPDGFYTVGDTDNPQPEFQKAIIDRVAAVTHIAEADENGQIIETDVVQPGVINYPLRELSLCAGITDARFTTTTEVYPDSPMATPESCIAAQVAAIQGGLDHVLGL